MGRQIDRLIPLRVRAAALMPAAALAVHQLRFQLAFGGQADAKLASEGHEYLGAVGPLAAIALAIGAGLFLASLARAWRRGTREDGASAPGAALAKVWLLAAAALLAIYCGQELLEGFLASGHPDGIAGVFGAGGLWAVPLSVLLGAVVACGLRVADAAVRWVAARGRRPSRRRPSRRSARPAEVLLALREPLAGAAAGRAPPLPLPVTS